MHYRKLTLPLLVLTVLFVVAFGVTKASTCTSGDCRVSAHDQRYFKAAPEYSHSWKSKMRLLGYDNRY